MNSFVSTHLKDADKVWLLNDTAFPEKKIVAFLKIKRIPLPMQEGIRFPLPCETEINYEAAGAQKSWFWVKDRLDTLNR